MKVRQVQKSDYSEWLRMRNQLWCSPEKNLEENLAEHSQ